MNRKLLALILFLFISTGYTKVKNITFTNNRYSSSAAIHLSNHQYNVDKRIYISKSDRNIDKNIYIDTDDIIEQKYILGFLSMQSGIINIKHEYILKSHMQYTSDHSVYFTNIQSTADICFYITDSKNNADIIVITKRNTSSLPNIPLVR